MCGIIGYLGDKNALEIMIEGLTKLEYRGYDSSGLTIVSNENLYTVKKEGRIEKLKAAVKDLNLKGHLGIGHTRWATHGEPSDINAHPHMNMKNTISVVHNGIIENYIELRRELEAEGIVFKSDTDTEVCAHIIDKYYEGDLYEAVRRAVKILKGAYALGICAKDEPGRLIAVKKENPLIMGIAKDGYYISSDILAILDKTKDIIYLKDGQIVDIKKDEYKITNFNGEIIEEKIETIDIKTSDATKEGFEHFMLKEIFEQPDVIKNTISRRLNSKGLIDFEDLKLTAETLKSINRIYIVACGTSYHSGLIGKVIFEKFTNILTTVEVSSEFSCNLPKLDENTLVIFISQSGETADSISALKAAREKHAKILSIVNVLGSTLARLSDYTAYTWAGPEISVASTKAYSSQLILLYLIAIDFSKKLNLIDEKAEMEILNNLKEIPKKLSSLLNDLEIYKTFAKIAVSKNSVFYLGRFLDYYTAKEAALKLKEISYVHAEALPAGELKHGPLALIERDTPVIVISTNEKLHEKMISTIKEVKARGAKTIAIVSGEYEAFESVSDYILKLPEIDSIFAPLVSVIPIQLLAYFGAIEIGSDVDKPRNLAKSVTVE
ncbi:MAG: glutamine--fructose-6-phosphate transaminase (isomerizing) [Tissierellia bacterium]|nr:glutamine--fructose-6-phosphate transaminase (isomerizing) [Tissierellia bacterium]